MCRVLRVVESRRSATAAHVTNGDGGGGDGGGGGGGAGGGGVGGGIGGMSDGVSFRRTVPGGVARAVRELAAALGRAVHATADSKPEKRSFLLVK